MKGAMKGALARAYRLVSVNKKEAYFYEGKLVRITPPFLPQEEYFFYEYFISNIKNREERGVYTSRKYSPGEYMSRKYLAIR